MSNYYIYKTKKSAGFSDLVAFKDGKTMFVEVKKSEKSKMSKEQKDFSRLMDATGFNYICTHSTTDLITQMKKAGLCEEIIR